MGLKCSVLGHAYGETTVERDREERGSEVVITIRELETCDRCGDTRIVTENKEVTTIETPDDEPEVTPEDAVEALESEGETASEGDAVEASSDALVDDAEGGAAVTDDAVSSPDPSAVEDQGAEILDDDDDSTEDSAVDDELADPTIENEADVPGDTGEGNEDAVILDDDSDDDAGGEPGSPSPERGEQDESAATTEHTIDDEEPAPFEAPADDSDDDGDPLGEWPEETLRDDPEDDWTPSEDLTGTVDDVDPDANVDRERSTNSAVTVPDGEFHCEECGYTTPVEASSLREGDYCPECRTATLIHRPEE